MTHHCHALLCKSPCPPRMLMCKPCWALVSPATQREVYRTVKLRAASCDASWAPWWRAAHTAMYEVAIAQGHDKEKGDAWLAREMKIADEMEKS